MTADDASRLALPDQAVWDKALTQAREWKSAEFRLVALTDDHIKQLLCATSQAEGEPIELLLRCEQVVFLDRIWFANTHVYLQLSQCRFDDEVSLGGTFENTALTGVTFARLAEFSQATFIGETTFANVRFAGGVRFDETRFRGDISFEATSFQHRASFIQATFEGAAKFKPGLIAEQQDSVPDEDVDSNHSFVLRSTGKLRPTTADSLDFGRAVFLGDAEFDLPVTGDLWFIDARVVRMHGSIAAENIAFDGSRFADDVFLSLRAARTSLVGARFEQRVAIRFAGDLVADNTVFDSDSTLTGPPHDSELNGRLLSLREASLSTLTLTELDLSWCLFWRAYGLDELRVEANCVFAGPPPTRRFTARQTLAEENLWRSRGGGQWRAPAFDDWLGGRVPAPANLGPAEIASIYRSLRKATETRKDEPGAADFYYGEMEMRRHAAPRASGERVLLSLFWGLSGYALRASRALIALAVICVCLAFAMHGYGFAAPQSLSDSLIYTFGSSARIKTGLADAPRTTGGEVTQIVLGVVGPILYGLALFSFRGRVKR